MKSGILFFALLFIAAVLGGTFVLYLQQNQPIENPSCTLTVQDGVIVKAHGSPRKPMTYKQCDEWEGIFDEGTSRE